MIEIVAYLQKYRKCLGPRAPFSAIIANYIVLLAIIQRKQYK